MKKLFSARALHRHHLFVMSLKPPVIIDDQRIPVANGKKQAEPAHRGVNISIKKYAAAAAAEAGHLRHPVNAGHSLDTPVRF